MNTSNIKKYAPQARNDFIAAMCKQAVKYGITADSILPAEQKGDLLLIGDQVFPLSVMKSRDKLIKRIQTSSFEQTIDYIASLYTTNFTEPLSYQGSSFLKLPKFP